MNAALTHLPAELEKTNEEHLVALCREQHQKLIQKDAALKSALETAAVINRNSFELVSQLMALLDSFEAGDQEAVAVHLKELAARRCAKMAETKERVH